MSRVIGIDLGTNSCRVAVFGKEGPQVITSSDNSHTIPVAVAFTNDGERLVGQPAKRQAVANPDSTIFSVKRIVGRRFDDPVVGQFASLVPFEIVPSPNGDAWVQVRGKSYSPSQILAFVLQEAKRTAESFLGSEVTKAVISIPAYFDDAQRQATRDAGRIAGFDVLRLVSEPTAAAFAYGFEKDDGKTIAVYDLGGGTFDISILEIGDGVFEVRSTNGDTFLGGEDFDARLVEFLVDDFKKAESIDLTQDKLALQRLNEAAGKAKIELSSAQTTEINLPFITADQNGPKHMVNSISRSDFEKLVGDLLERTLDSCKTALKDADVNTKDIDDVLMVGGMTRMPKVREAVEKFFGKEPLSETLPEDAVAIGMAIHAGLFEGAHKDALLLDVTPLSLGIETQGGVFTRMIDRNTTIPTKKMQTFSTADNNQQAVSIRVFQGEREMAADNKLLGQFDLVGIPLAPRGQPQIDVTFSIDNDNIIEVSAKDKSTGKEQQINIQASGGLSNADIEQMVQGAEMSAEEDKQRREVAETKNNIESLLHSSEKQLEEHEGKIDADLRGQVEEAIKETKEAIEGDDVEAMKTKSEALTQAAMQLGQEIYEQEQARENRRAAPYRGHITEFQSDRALWVISDRDTEHEIACQIPDEGRRDPRFTMTWSSEVRASTNSLCGAAYKLGKKINTNAATAKLYEANSRWMFDVIGDEVSLVIEQLHARVEDEIDHHDFCRFEFSHDDAANKNSKFDPSLIFWFDLNSSDDGSRSIGVMLADSILDQCQDGLVDAVRFNHDLLDADKAAKFISEVKPRIRNRIEDEVLA